ncbi:hypothetical protein PoB_005017700 [Plakobranchus ocellatus]|uniref:Uncharacterized protein n=1 Tax=Plakobranchus ocellatus TaxID=259542 RepID=A0AAV4BX68_9GAST|nr:hypothetical protein PoB_005017700 [Plakobranchus ocellatus]
MSSTVFPLNINNSNHNNKGKEQHSARGHSDSDACLVKQWADAVGVGSRSVTLTRTIVPRQAETTAAAAAAAANRSQASPQQGDLRLSGTSPSQRKTQTRVRRVPSDLRADSLATVPSPPSRRIEEGQRQR